jgi:hypothetical protein
MIQRGETPGRVVAQLPWVIHTTYSQIAVTPTHCHGKFILGCSFLAYLVLVSLLQRSYLMLNHSFYQGRNDGSQRGRHDYLLTDK